jgi:SAM-dependent methyltransferase
MPALLSDDIYDPQVRVDPRSPSAQFLTSVLNGKWRILDAAAGNGCDSAMLFRHGHSVICNEINSEQLSDAKFIADELGAQIQFTSYRWETFNELFPAGEKFDAIIVTRNAFAMAESGEQQKGLKSFIDHLAPEGVLLIDERANSYGGEADGTFAPHPFAHGELFTMLKTFERPVDLYADFKLQIADVQKMPVILTQPTIFTYVLHNV